MSGSGFQFDASQQFQLDAINSVVGLFDGQPKDADKLITTLSGSALLNDDDQLTLDLDLTQEVGAIGNNLVLDRELILANMQNVQDQNGLEVSEKLFDSALDFDVEMETGTGKTYVYLRTIFELADKYNFRKFVILVPSVAIREGVNTSIRLMREHFRSLYPSYPFDASVYSGKNAEEVQSFATSTNVQILVMTIGSIRERAAVSKGDEAKTDTEARLILNRTRDKLNGLRPIDYLNATHPVVIMDEPQNMESEASADALKRLQPAFTLRYSATHKKRRNVVYRLDPVDAHDLGLVKQIVVAEVLQQGADAAPYVKLVSVKRDPQWTARLELSVRAASGQLERREVNVRQNQELSDERITGNPAYEGIWVTEMNIGMGGEPASVELNLHGVMSEGETIGASSSAIYKEMIRETIREHLRKESMLRTRGIKVLSLFFVDKVASYMGDGTTNDSADGDFVKWFDEVFIEERAKSADYQELLPQAPSELRRAYFSQIKRGKTLLAGDTSGTTKADDDAYELIMQDKERLLDESEPVRFIFSHSALREGWDNPNVFQICTLREMGAEVERRQTIGRGLRLPVTKTDKGYERVADRGIATLTVIANESYTAFARSLQNEYKDAGVEIGRVRFNEFAKIAARNLEGKVTDDALGYAKSKEIYDHLTQNGYLTDGQVTSKFLPNTLGFSLNLPEYLKDYELEIIEAVGKSSLERYIKPKSDRKERTLNKALFLTPEFEEFWYAISRKTTYRVRIKRDDIINNAVTAINNAPKIDPLRIQITRAGVKVLRGGAKGQELGTRSAELKGSYDLPDIISELQEMTSLTRKTIVDILIASERLDEFIGNPNDFIAMVKRALQGELAKMVVEGIQYEKIAGSIYELRELQKDGEEEKERFLDQMYKVHNSKKTDFDYVVFDSDVERQFAEKLDSREDVKFFMKLPAKFKIPTPVGDYNPDWAIIKQVDGEDRLYMIRETKSVLDERKLRPTEVSKIVAASRHFKAIGIDDYAVSAPEAWNL
jgi:type III restriction enzyme